MVCAWCEVGFEVADDGRTPDKMGNEQGGMGGGNGKWSENF